ncbi:MAG: FAD-dependent 5-carboxymethylaminomethyl-2-thiouridine(34) oxidoreductase MnmC [Rhodospirillales bacterium]|nr:FAD-dependent 5-carboxymethylaminomethyl-2-thiouridine(34) oxidoreductase MnmC [Alphaproteobacteria bacterium]USO05664.1 MAG: FAD-dependent 5-carboxymethylaminomethyl-2-thiouridine(34) oxidoreductase MnmC [Rhodospirillales bacterium]
MKIAIVGGGIAGCALAYTLKNAGLHPVVYETEATLASGASGNPFGLYNPRLNALRTPQSDFYISAYSMALRTFATFDDVGWMPSGALHLMNDDKKERRYSQMVQNWNWDEGHMRLVDADEASEIAGIQLAFDALHLPQSGSVSLKKLCAAYMNDVDYHLNAPVDDPDSLDSDAVVLASGPGVFKFLPDLPLGKVRGQITQVRATPQSEKLKCHLCYGGYMMPAREGVHVLGSTFQRWLDHSQVLEQDDAENLDKLAQNIPGLESGLEVVDHRAAVRVTSRDHFPVVGRVSGRRDMYVSTAHGSHGIVSSIMAAHVIADMILGRPYCLGTDSVEALSPERFI